MKVNIKSYIKRVLPLFIVGAALTACEDFLDKQPPSYIVPEDYYRSEDQILASANKFYTDLLPSHGGNYGTFQSDVHTNNQAGRSGDSKYAIGQWKVGMDNGNWSWSAVRNINYQLGTILDRYGKGEISGADKNIRHYIGEHYFFRAFRYFAMLRMWGDLPIVKEVFPDDEAILVAACKRMPRNEVARFILEDLDTAIDYMSDNFESRHTRISKDVAILMKSRVALFEGSWLTNFKGTPFVPNGEGWPGKAKEYNAGYTFPSGSIDIEINFFFDEAIAASQIIADKHTLTTNTGYFAQNPEDTENPYFSMFCSTDMDKYDEVLLWKRYDWAQGVANEVCEYACTGNHGVGTTKSMVDAFILKNGEPIYASPMWADENNSYWGDNNMEHITKNRDTRADIFIKKPGQRNLHTPPQGTVAAGREYETKPDITAATVTDKYNTGYAIRKGLNPDGKYTANTQSNVGSIVFRAAEAYLNYIEAYYERYGTLNDVAEEYWRTIRRRAGVNEDFQKTIRLTDMAKEAETDWGAYSAGQVIDATRYNIRRERRCELMAEGLRSMDLHRWRAMDQMITKPYHILGMNLWQEMYNWDWYKDGSGNSILKEGENVSSRNFSTYLAPYHITANNIAYNGYRWHMAHYLDPIAIEHFLVTSQGGDLNSSPIYQNPGWPMIGGGTPE